jgi:hypothetical protein
VPPDRESLFGATMSCHANHTLHRQGHSGRLESNPNGPAVDIRCDLNRYDQDVLAHAHKLALDTTRATLNLFNFATGDGLTLAFENLIDPNGVSTIFLPRDLRVAPLCTAFSLTAKDGTFSQVIGIVLTEPPLFMALNELLDSLILPHAATINCARAIERLKHLVAPSGTPRKQMWEYLRHNLRIEQKYLEFVTDYSTGPRHGDPTFIPGTIGAEVTRRAWTIMNRFLEFRKRGNQALPESDFPLLVS